MCNTILNLRSELIGRIRGCGCWPAGESGVIRSSSVLAVPCGSNRIKRSKTCRYAITGSESEWGELPVWHLRLYSIRRKILAFFAFLIFGVFLLGGVAITLSHRMHTYTAAVRSETQDLRRIDELRMIFLDFLVEQHMDLSLAA